MLLCTVVTSRNAREGGFDSSTLTPFILQIKRDDTFGFFGYQFGYYAQEMNSYTKLKNAHR